MATAKNKHIWLLVMLFCLSASACKDDETVYPEKVFDGSVTLASQSDVDDFGSNNYTEVTGHLQIGPLGELSDIQNLTPLRSINTVGWHLYVSNTQLTHLNDISGITTIGTQSSIGGRLGISANNLMTDVQGLRNITNIYQIVISDNEILKEVTNFKNRTSIAELFIGYNPSLENLNGLSTLDLADYLTITDNESLKNFCGLRDLINYSSLSEEVVQMENNAFNPTYEELINSGECNFD